MIYFKRITVSHLVFKYKRTFRRRCRQLTHLLMDSLFPGFSDWHAHVISIPSPAMFMVRVYCP